MRALEITIWAIAVLVAPSMFQAMGVFAVQYGGCESSLCQTQQFLYNMANQTTLEPLDITTQTSPASMAWDAVTFGITFVVFSVFWLLYLLSLITIIQPALVTMFHVPAPIANYINIFYWLLWMIAIIQFKRGGLSVDGYK